MLSPPSFRLINLFRVLIETVQISQYLRRPVTGAQGDIGCVAENRLGRRTAAQGRGAIGGRAGRHPLVLGYPHTGAVALAQDQQGNVLVGHSNGERQAGGGRAKG